MAISPGFMSTEGYIAWYGPRLASQGFVVITIATNTLADFPAQRGDQLLAALKYVVEKSEAKSRVDGSRLAVMGHSMGGGGSLEATLKFPAMQAVIPLTGWDMNTNFSALRTPALIIGAQADFIAPVGAHSRPFYQSLPATLDRAYLGLAGASHFAPNTPNVTIAKYSISWLKRFVDNDTRYEQFLCPIPREPTASAFEGKCPHG